MRPSNELPVSVPTGEDVVTDGERALHLSTCRVFSSGVEFALTALNRTERHQLGRHPGHDLLLGLEFADGTVAIAPRFGRHGADSGLLRVTGSSGGRHTQQTFYLTRLPPPGPLTVRATIAGSDLPDLVVTLSGEEIRAAAERVRRLWPEAPPEAPAPPPELPAPEGSWFAGR
ncbi:hypothetical protein [Amycolatopsis sacchari]|uniref:Uncharacterized protein n=1 Tax=Amycolatopsis sacchari TaxID=115433 RepID=A0A1I3PZM1_9PSEU|nr:hypothetical protein [Amycolatopsis sacchari]SFJ27098.1 hypothetical protein SAMN05421835_104118 [Amycolatopsis sacchari]